MTPLYSGRIVCQDRFPRLSSSLTASGNFMVASSRQSYACRKMLHRPPESFPLFPFLQVIVSLSVDRVFLRIPHYRKKSSLSSSTSPSPSARLKVAFSLPDATENLPALPPARSAMESMAAQHPVPWFFPPKVPHLLPFPGKPTL